MGQGSSMVTGDKMRRTDLAGKCVLSMSISGIRAKRIGCDVDPRVELQRVAPGQGASQRLAPDAGIYEHERCGRWSPAGIGHRTVCGRRCARTLSSTGQLGVVLPGGVGSRARGNARRGACARLTGSRGRPARATALSCDPIVDASHAQGASRGIARPLRGSLRTPRDATETQLPKNASAT